MIAFAQLIERRIEDGTVRDYADAARYLCVTRAWITQLVSLLAVPAQMQEREIFHDPCSCLDGTTPPDLERG